MRCNKFTTAVLVATLVMLSVSYAYAEEFLARLNGFQELGALNAETGAIRSNATGTLHLKLDESARTATFTLTYSDVGTTEPGTGTVTQAHIHFGKVHATGGIMVFFCTNVGNSPGTQACPANSGTVTGTFTPDSVIAIGGQNVVAHDFDALVDALRSNTAYANIHTTKFTAGEIRGQIRKDNVVGNDNKNDNGDQGKDQK